MTDTQQALAQVREAQAAENERLRERLRIVADELDNLLAKEQR